MPEGDRRELAMGIVDRHRDGKKKRRLRDITAEKYLLHVDATNDGQWAEIVNGQEVFVRPKLSGSLRLQRNLLRPIVDNMVAYHTATPLKVVADAPPGRRARDRARVDAMLANHIISDQGLNQVLAEAMYVAAIYGNCPVHVSWRYQDQFVGFMDEGPDGMVDIWCGDPWDTVYDDAATRNSVLRASYGRTLPMSTIREAFGDVPWVSDGSVKGSDRLPSASRFQRIYRRWEYLNQAFRESASIRSGYKNDEMVAIICEETLPGVLPDWPDGRLAIVAIDQAAETENWTFSGSTHGEYHLLHVGPLPCRRFSFVRFYANGRMDDALGKPYVADLSDLQVQLNNLVTLRAERLRKFAKPKLMAQTGSFEEDTMYAGGDTVAFYNTEMPKYLDPPSMGIAEFDLEIDRIETMMFRIGGWQAASRGEGTAGDPAAKVVALAKADDTIFGPMSRAFQESLNALLQICHHYVREYAERPFLARVAGEDLAYAIDPWVRSEKMSQRDPQFRAVNSFGATPEAMAQTLASLVTIQAADGQPLLTKDEFWTKYPDPALRPHEPNLRMMKLRKCSAINHYIEEVADGVVEQYREILASNPEMINRAIQEIGNVVMARYPIERTDDIGMCIASLDELIHDITTSQLAREVAKLRQALYFDWLAMQSEAQVGGQPPRTMQPKASSSGTAPRFSDPNGGTSTSNTVSPIRTRKEVNRLTAAAGAGQVN